MSDDKGASWVTWLLGLALCGVSLAVLLVHPAPRDRSAETSEDGVIDLATLAEKSRAGDVRAEVVAAAGRAADLVLYSTRVLGEAEGATDGESSEEQGKVSIRVADGRTIRIDRRDLELGTRVPLPDEAPELTRGAPLEVVLEAPPPPPPDEVSTTADSEAADSPLGETESADGDPAELAGGDVEPGAAGVTPVEASRLRPRAGSQRIAMRMIDRRPQAVGSPPVRTIQERLVFTLEPGPFRLAETGGLEVPVFVVARRPSPGSGPPVATTVSLEKVLLVEASGFEPRRVRIEKGRARSTEPVFLPLRRDNPLRVTASRLDRDDGGESSGSREPAVLDLTWEDFGPASLELRVRPPGGESFSTRLSPLALSVHLESEGQRLRPGIDLPILVETPAGVLVEAQEARLGADGEPLRVHVRADRSLADQVVFAAPDLGLETPVAVRFHPPWRFLVIAGVLGLLGVAVSRRKKLFEQKKVALAFELLTAVAGGLLLYVAFLTEWLPTPGLLLGELPAAAVGILGGYLGEGVFQLVSRRLRLTTEES